MIKFQSTHPSRGATMTKLDSVDYGSFQSTHPSRGATEVLTNAVPDIYVSIHAPLAGCDTRGTRMSDARRGFNPRTPRGVRPVRSTDPSSDGVSIHAPLAGCDSKRSHKGNILPRIYGCYSPQIRFFSAVRPTPLLWHGSSAYILSCDFLFTSPSRS